MSTRRFELVDEKSSKFWEISQNDRSYTVCFGKIGTIGQSKTKEMETQETVSNEVAKLVKVKIAKGYVERLFSEELLVLRDSGATSILIYYRGCGDDGCFEWAAFNGCKKIPDIVSDELAEFIIGKTDLNDLDGMAEGAIGIIHVDLSTGKVYAQESSCVSIGERVEEFLGLCSWAKCKSIKARIKLQVDDNFIEVKKVAKAIPVAGSDFVKERLQSLFGFIQNNEGYEEEFPSDTEDSSLYDILLSHCGNEGDEFDLVIDVNKGRFEFRGVKGCFEFSFPSVSEKSLGCLQSGFSFDLSKVKQAAHNAESVLKVLSDEKIAKIRKLIDSKSLNNLKMAIHLLESVEAKPMDWSKAFNKNTLDNLCETKDIEIYALLANAFQSDKDLMDGFVKSSTRIFSGLEDLEEFMQNLFVNYSEPLYLIANQLIKTLNSIINSDSFDPYRYGLDLNQLKTLSVSAASCLSAFKASQIDLNGLTSINAEAAKSLSKFRGHLDLDGLTDLSEEAAISLINHKDKYHDNGISLNGLTEITDSVAVALGRKNGFLSLNGLTVLSEAAADALGRQKGELYLNGLNSISDGVARALSKHQHLHIEGLKYISDATAESLSKYKHSLVLDGLISISDTAADALSKHEGSLSLDGLKTISDPAAESLSKLKGSLSLDGLKTISDAAAKALSEHEGSLSLGGLKSISDAACEALSRHNGYIFLKKSLENKLIRFIKKSGKSRKSSK